MLLKKNTSCCFIAALKMEVRILFIHHILMSFAFSIQNTHVVYQQVFSSLYLKKKNKGEKD